MKIIFSGVDEAYSQHLLLPEAVINCVKKHSLVRQKTFLAGRVLLNMALKQFYGVNSLPKMFIGEHGKPEFFEARYPRFNISHSRNLIVLGLSDSSVGIDVECFRKRFQFDKLKEYLFDAKELTYFRGLDLDSQLFLFKVLWTVRECLIKFTGRGLLDLRAIRTDLLKKTFSYFSAHGNLHVSARKIEPSLFNTSYLNENEGCLAFSLKPQEAVEFYRHENGLLVACEPPLEVYDFRKAN